jgi:hypothetical protein
MKNGKHIKQKPNKSSIIRVIISNFDNKQVKEIKVLYTKQGGVDVIKLKGTRENQEGKMVFDFDCAYNMLENEETYSLGVEDEQSFLIDTNEENTELCITKKHKITGEIIRKYTIQGKYDTVKSGKTKVTVSVTDTKDYSNAGDLKDKLRVSRSLCRSTNRILLDRNIVNNYRQIVCSDLETIDETINIDSQEIYKINRFLSYRSNMIIYYQIINNFLLYI